jgi:hypothetical protein
MRPAYRIKDIKVFFSEEGARGGLDGGEGGEVALDKCNWWAFGFGCRGEDGFDVRDCGDGFGFAARGEVDLG